MKGWAWLYRLLGQPHLVVQDGYLHRWHLVPRNSKFNVYLHLFRHPDPGRDPHDHPWHSLSFCLWGSMVEQYGDPSWPDEDVIGLGSIRYRRPEHCHRISQVSPCGCLTLFFTGPVVRTWGFRTFLRWIPHTEYDNK